VRTVAITLFLGLIFAGGYEWRECVRLADSRAQWLSAPISTRGDIGISFAASGFLNRDVIVTAFVLGDEDKSTEDFWLEELAHGESAADLYQRGFRRIRVGGGRISRLIAPNNGGKTT
jgi:hypothetical protein